MSAVDFGVAVCANDQQARFANLSCDKVQEEQGGRIRPL
jgi:hypothetical protein